MLLVVLDFAGRKQVLHMAKYNKVEGSGVLQGLVIGIELETILVRKLF